MILETDGNKHLAHLSLSLFKSHLSLSKCHPPTWPENSFIVQRSHLTKTQKDEAKKTKQNRTQQILNWVWLAKYWNPDTDRYIIYNIYIYFYFHVKICSDYLGRWSSGMCYSLCNRLIHIRKASPFEETENQKLFLRLLNNAVKCSYDSSTAFRTFVRKRIKNMDVKTVFEGQNHLRNFGRRT